MMQVSKMGFGCMGLTGSYNSPLDDDAGAAVVAHAFRRGVTFFDTSDVYGPHTNETLLGKVRLTWFLESELLTRAEATADSDDIGCDWFVIVQLQF